MFLINKYCSNGVDKGAIFIWDQAALWMVMCVRPSIHPSVCLPITHFSQCLPHRIITKFSGVITIYKGDAKSQGHRSKVKVTLIKTTFAQIWEFPTMSPVWIHSWLRNDAQCFKWHRRGALLFLDVIRQISRSLGPKKLYDFAPKLAFPDCNSSLN